MEEQDHSDHPGRHTVVQHWVSVGDVIVLIASVVTTVAGLAFTYGGLARDVRALSAQVTALQDRDITPGARSEISRLVAKDAAQDDQIAFLRDELIRQRTELVSRLDRIETALDNHDRSR